ncbi:MAG: tRNA (adenosine(37)-N6)-threonylcarbamoyltransferase complex transferase subunit TsaD [bacterium]
MLVLGIETSCDETSVALARLDGAQAHIEDQIIASQIEQHRPFGGVVPEVAVRQHLQNLPRMTRELLERNRLRAEEVDGIGVTRGPGLASSLMIGLSFAKALALAAKKPWIGVNHLEGHMFSPFLAQNRLPEKSHVALIVSGGHTLLLHARRMDSFWRYEKLGTTLDDAAGEAFDKAAKMLGLDYPGGPQIEKWAAKGRADAIDFPRGMAGSGDLNFSFSGLKTAVRIYIGKHPEVLSDEQKKADVCASFQQAVIDALVQKTRAACRQARTDGADCFTVSGGVSCNRALRQAMETMAREENVECFVAPPALSTDNAAMIAVVAGVKLLAGETSSWDVDIDPNLKLETAS